MDHQPTSAPVAAGPVNGVPSKATYDDAGQLTELKTTRASSDVDAGKVVSHLRYSYVTDPNVCLNAPAPRPTSIRHRVTDVITDKTTVYCYDKAGRMTSATTSPGGPIYNYGFDPNTNRASGPEGTHTVNVVDQLTDTGFFYNLDGSLEAGGGLSGLTYNGINQTESITKAGNTTDYDYAGGGQGERTTAGPTSALYGLAGMVSETTAGATTYYVRDASGALIIERTPTAGDFYYVFDGQGSVIALVDPSGTQRVAYTYDPYGDHALATEMGGTLPPNPWRWIGGYLDATGLYKMGARYYDPALGRFTQLDPVAGGSANGYDYCAGDPVNCSDGSGLAMDPLPVELYDPCMNLIRNGVADPESDVCRRYRTAILMRDSDYFYLGGRRPVRSDFERAIHKIGQAAGYTARCGPAFVNVASGYSDVAMGMAGVAFGVATADPVVAVFGGALITGGAASVASSVGMVRDEC